MTRGEAEYYGIWEALGEMTAEEKEHFINTREIPLRLDYLLQPEYWEQTLGRPKVDLPPGMKTSFTPADMDLMKQMDDDEETAYANSGGRHIPERLMKLARQLQLV